MAANVGGLRYWASIPDISQIQYIKVGIYVIHVYFIRWYYQL